MSSEEKKKILQMVEDGKITLFQPEEGPGVCDVSGGEALLANM